MVRMISFEGVYSGLDDLHRRTLVWPYKVSVIALAEATWLPGQFCKLGRLESAGYMGSGRLFASCLRGRLQQVEQVTSSE